MAGKQELGARLEGLVVKKIGVPNLATIHRWLFGHGVGQWGWSGRGGGGDGKINTALSGCMEVQYIAGQGARGDKNTAEAENVGSLLALN